MNSRINSCLLSVFVLLTAHRLASDTLFKKSTAVAIGIGDTKLTDIRWTDCKKQESKKYVKPPYWVDKSDNCQLKAENFGLRKSGAGFEAENMDKLLRLFPDAKKGNVVGFEDVASTAVLMLKFRDRPLDLPYRDDPSDEQVSNNELSMAAGFANVNRYDVSADLLESVKTVVTRNRTERRVASNSFFAGASASIRDVSYDYSTEIAKKFHSLFTDLAEYRSALEKAPDMPFSRGAAMVIGGGPQLIGNSFFDFGGLDADMIVLQPGPGGTMPTHILFQDDGFRGGRQLLDGIYWDRVTFIRTHIVYRGGLVFLRGMHFVDCSFEVINSPRGNDFLNFVVNQLPQFMVDTENDQPPANQRR